MKMFGIVRGTFQICISVTYRGTCEFRPHNVALIVRNCMDMSEREREELIKLIDCTT